VFSCSKIEQVQWNTWVSFQSAQRAKLGQFSVSGNNIAVIGENSIAPASIAEAGVSRVLAIMTWVDRI